MQATLDSYLKPIKPKPQRAMSLSQSAKSTPDIYQIRASSLPLPIISQDFLRSPIRPGTPSLLRNDGLAMTRKSKRHSGTKKTAELRTLQQIMHES